MKIIKTMLIGVFAVLFSACDRSVPGGDVPDYISVGDVKRSEMVIKKIWYGRGRVIIGRLKIPEGVRVVTRTSIYRDGSFCAPLYPNRKMVYYVDGYEPLVISEFTKISKYVYDAGTLSFIPAEPKSLRTVKGSVIVDETEKAPIECNLKIWNKKYLSDDHGYRGGEPIVTATSRKLVNGQQFQFEKLSRIPYMLVWNAPGYITKKLEIRPEQTGAIDLGEIRLTPAKTFQINYRVRVRQKGEKWIDKGEAVTGEVICDGRSQFLFSEEKDGMGTRLSLRMEPKDDIVVASFFYHKENSFFEMPTSKLEGFPKWSELDVSGLKGTTESVIREGPLFFFTVDDIRGTDIQLLFRASLK